MGCAQGWRIKPAKGTLDIALSGCPNYPVVERAALQACGGRGTPLGAAEGILWVVFTRRRPRGSRASLAKTGCSAQVRGGLEAVPFLFLGGISSYQCPWFVSVGYI